MDILCSISSVASDLDRTSVLHDASLDEVREWHQFPRRHLFMTFSDIQRHNGHDGRRIYIC